MRALWLLGLVACAGGGPPGDTDAVDDTDGAVCGPAGETRILATGFDRSKAEDATLGTEGVTLTDDGVVYVTARETLEIIEPDGTVVYVQDLPSNIGLTWWDGAVWGTSNKDAEGATEHALVAHTPGGASTRHVLDTDLSLNFIAPTPWGTLLVADPGSDGVYEWVRGEDTLTLWEADLASPNGMAFSPDGLTLYVAHTFRDAGLSAVAIDGEASGGVSRLFDVPATDAPDGIAVAEDGSVWVTMNTGKRLDVWRDGERSTVSDAVPFAASIAFGRGAWDPCEAVVTSLFSGDVFAVQTGVRGFFPPWEAAAGRE